jgi:predicted RNA-binding Zn ribbon-like protein
MGNPSPTVRPSRVRLVCTGDTSTSAPLLGEVLPVELMNTIWADRDGLHDALASPDETLAWLRAIQPRLQLQPSVVTRWLHAARPTGVRETADRLRELRDALRRLAADTTGDPRSAATSAIGDREVALEVLGRSCAAAPTWSTLLWPAGHAPGRAMHSGGTPGQAVVSMLAEQTVDLFTGELQPPLRACLAPGCVLYFVKQHPRREWCSAACGNRARVARHYQRHRNDATAP